MVKLFLFNRFCGSRLQRQGWRLISILAAMFWAISAGAASFTVTLDRDHVAVNESTMLMMTFSDGSPDSIPQLPNLPNLKIQDTGESTSIEFINGHETSKYMHNFQLTPTKAGVYVIPGLSAAIGGQNYQSSPVKLTVGASAGRPQANNNNQNAFLKLVVSKTDVYVGELLPVEIDLYFQNARGDEMPHLNEEGFTLGKMQNAGQSTTTINGIQYNVVVLKTYVVPVRAGKLDLGPASISINLPRSTGRNIFGQLMVTDWEPVTLQSDPLTLQVKPLPRDNVPAGFSGAVGSFSLNRTVSPTNVAVGDPITVKLALTGQGALESVTLPEQTGWQQFKLYPPTSDFQASDTMGTTGTKTFSLTAVPQNLDIKELPAFVFSYFDPDLKQYQTLTQPALPLIVRPSAASLPPPTLGGNSSLENSTNQDIITIKARFGKASQLPSPLIGNPIFWIFQVLPVAAWLGLLINRKRRENLVKNPRLRRQRQVDQIVRRGLKDLHRFAEANQGVEFFATLFRLLQEQLGERLDLPASAITEAVLDTHLRPLQLPAEQMQCWHELFQICNQARYSQHTTNAELRSLIPKIETGIEDLKNLKP